MSRREVMKLCLLGAAGAWLGPAALAEETGGGGQASPAATAVHKRLRGPLASVTVPFNKDYSVDLGALRAWADFMCEHQAPVLFHTFGDGEIDALSEQEIEAINLALVEQVNGRALVVGATGPWWTGRMVEFIKRMEEAGLEAINVHFSLSIKQQAQLKGAFEAIADATDIPLLVYDNGLSAGVITELAAIPQVIGVKSHANLYQFYTEARDTRELPFAVLGAGQMKQFLYGVQVGSPGYLCPLAPAAPDVSLRFFHAAMGGDLKAARRIVFEYEEPLLETTIPIGYPQAYKAMLYLRGLYPTHLVRPPRISKADAALGPLRSFMQDKGIIS